MLTPSIILSQAGSVTVILSLSVFVVNVGTMRGTQLPMDLEYDRQLVVAGEVHRMVTTFLFAGEDLFAFFLVITLLFFCSILEDGLYPGRPSVFIKHVLIAMISILIVNEPFHTNFHLLPLLLHFVTIAARVHPDGEFTICGPIAIPLWSLPWAILTGAFVVLDYPHATLAWTTRCIVNIVLTWVGWYAVTRWQLDEGTGGGPRRLVWVTVPPSPSPVAAQAPTVLRAIAFLMAFFTPPASPEVAVPPLPTDVQVEHGAGRVIPPVSPHPPIAPLPQAQAQSHAGRLVPHIEDDHKWLVPINVAHVTESVNGEQTPIEEPKYELWKVRKGNAAR